jgi:ABC-type multidrug transport system ATPase subunit
MKEAAARALDEDAPPSYPEGDAVVFEGVTYRYDPRARPALDACSFSIRAGRRVVVVGENGAGKSTMLALAAGARLAMSEPISIHGAHPSQQNLRAPTSTPRVAYLGPAFKQQLETCAAISKATPFGETLQAYKDDAFQERAKRLMALLHVEESWRTGLCSSGQKTRLQLVLQLAPRADVRIMDELTRDLDALARHRVLAFLKRDAATCLYATHVFQGLDGWATDVLRVRRGSCVVEDASSVDVAGALLRGLRNDADLPPPPPPVEPPPKQGSTNLPAGWASRRANTLEGGFGAHGWTTASAVGAEHAGEISTAHQAFADLYESGGKR